MAYVRQNPREYPDASGLKLAGWYAGLQETKAYLEARSGKKDSRITAFIEAFSRFVEQYTGRHFYPVTAQRYYDYHSATQLNLWADLLSVSTLEDDDGAITSSYYTLHSTTGRSIQPYDVIKMEDDWLEYSDYAWRAIKVTGEWGYCNETEELTANGSAVTLDGDTSASVGTFTVSDGSGIDVGWTLLIGGERIFPYGWTTVDSTTILSGNITEVAESIDVVSGSALSEGEVVRIDQEDMLITDINSNSLQVERGYNNTSQSSHSDLATVYVYRKLYIERGVNGSTAATHSGGDSIYKYVPPANVSLAVKEMVASEDKRADSGYMGASSIRTEGGQYIHLGELPTGVKALLDPYRIIKL